MCTSWIGHHLWRVGTERPGWVHGRMDINVFLKSEISDPGFSHSGTCLPAYLPACIPIYLSTLLLRKE